MLETIFEKRASLENPSTPLSDPANWLYEALGAQPSSTNIIVSEQSALQLTAFWSAVNTIADTVGDMPLRLIRTQRNGAKKVVTDHPALEVLKVSPNDFMTPVVMKSTVQAHVLTWGNGFMWLRSTNGGEPAELWPLDPVTTKGVVKDGRLLYNTRLSDGPATLPAEEVLHVRGMSRNGIMGLSVIGAQREALGSALAVQQFGSKFFANGAKPGGLVSFPGKIKDPAKTRKAISDQYTGENVHGLLVLDNGADYKQFAVPPDDAQFLQSREYSVDDIGRMFRLPAHFLNKMGQATFNNLEQMGAHFVQYTMVPWLTRWEQELTRRLLTPNERKRGMAFKFIVAGLMRGDNATRSQFYASAINTGWMTRNEAREREDMNPLPGLDEPVMPLNMQKDKDADNDEPDDDGNNDDSGTEDPADGDDTSRALHVLRAMVDRVCAKESIAAQRIFTKRKPLSDRLEDLRAFYESHSALLVENLAIDPAIAREYCQRMFDGLASNPDIEGVLNSGAADLFELASEGMG